MPKVNDTRLMSTQQLFDIFHCVQCFSPCDATGNATTETFSDDDVSGVQIKQTIAGLDCMYTVASKSVSDVNEVSCCARFDPAASGEKLWEDLKENGKLTDKCIDENFKSERSQTNNE